MARGWGKSEEDLGADREHAREAARAPGGSRGDARRSTEARSIRMSLARIADQLARTENSPRREALETARRELEARLSALDLPDGGDES